MQLATTAARHIHAQEDDDNDRDQISTCASRAAAAVHSVEAPESAFASVVPIFPLLPAQANCMVAQKQLAGKKEENKEEKYMYLDK
jgi:hypothetical protein